MNKIKFIKDSNFTTFAIKDGVIVAYIIKKSRKNIYKVVFMKNRKIENCLVKNLETAKKIILIFEVQDDRKQI